MTTRPAAALAGPDDGLDGALVELTVGPVAHGGHCVARHDGRVVFVRHALPGERVRAVVTEEHTSYLRADAVEILEASAHRVTPPCPWADNARGVRPTCGGCDLQHADLAYQRELKSAVLREQLVRLGGLDPSTVDCLDPVVRPLPPVPGEPDGQGWRTRVQYTVDSTGRAGLLAHRSYEVVAVDRCLIAHAAIRGTDVLRRSWPEPDADRAGGQRGPGPEGRHVIEVVAGAEGPPTVLARRGEGPVTRVSGPPTVVEQAVGRRWTLPPTAFWQVHPAAADVLAATVVELLAPRPGDRIWDLYGGAGLFAAALAAGAGPDGRITVVEGDPVAVAAARENLRDLRTVTIVHSDVARALRGPLGPGTRPHLDGRARRERPWPDRDADRRDVDRRDVDRRDVDLRDVDLVVLDPPRSGAGREVVTAVAQRGPRALAYVACDPAALARDVRTLRTSGYELTALRAFDLFPHTHHLEAVALLTPA